MTAVKLPMTPSRPSASCRPTASLAKSIMSSESPDSRRLCAATPCSHEYLCMASRAYFTFWQSPDDSEPSRFPPLCEITTLFPRVKFFLVFRETFQFGNVCKPIIRRKIIFFVGQILDSWASA